jgi:hypothetical protein
MSVTDKVGESLAKLMTQVTAAFLAIGLASVLFALQPLQ